MRQPHPFHDRFRRRTRLSVACLALAATTLLSTGCLSRPPLQKQHFSLSLPTPASAPKPALDDVVDLRRVTVAPQFEGRSLAYRISDTAYELDPYAEFLVPPDRLIGGAARQWLRQSGLFRDVTEPTSLLKASRIAEIHVTQFHGDFRQPADAAAVLSLRIVVHAATPASTPSAAGGAKTPADAACAKDYSRRIRLSERTATAVVQGLQQALGECLAEFAADLQPARANH